MPLFVFTASLIFGMQNEQHFTSLVQKYIDGTLTAEEQKSLLQLLESTEFEEVLLESYEQSGEIHSWSDNYRKLFARRLLQKNSNACCDAGTGS